MTHGSIGTTKRHGSTLEGMWMYGSRNEYYGYGYGTYGEKYLATLPYTYLVLVLRLWHLR